MFNRQVSENQPMPKWVRNWKWGNKVARWFQGWRNPKTHFTGKEVAERKEKLRKSKETPLPDVNETSSVTDTDIDPEKSEVEAASARQRGAQQTFRERPGYRR